MNALEKIDDFFYRSRLTGVEQRKDSRSFLEAFSDKPTRKPKSRSKTVDVYQYGRLLETLPSVKETLAKYHINTVQLKMSSRGILVKTIARRGLSFKIHEHGKDTA